MNKIFYISCTVLIASLFSFPGMTQEIHQPENKNRKLAVYQQLTAGYIFGGQVYNDNFLYNPGFQFQTSYGVSINKNVAMGLGTGLKLHDKESFIPVFTEIVGYKKNKNNTPLIRMQLGYSLGWDNTHSNIEGYEFKGGLFIDVGMGRKIKLNENYSILFQWSYQHQFAKMEYDVFNTSNYSQVLNYDMIVITLGIVRDAY
jgi:hypothetical protein